MSEHARAHVVDVDGKDDELLAENIDSPRPRADVVKIVACTQERTQTYTVPQGIMSFFRKLAASE